MAESPEQYGYSQETWDRTATAGRVDAQAVFGKVMFLVAVTAGFTAAGAYIGRDLSGGWAIGAFIAAIALTFVIGAARRKDEASPLQMGILFAIGQMLALAWLGPVIAAVQHIVPPSMRATASASFLFIINLIGIGFGIWFLGRMSKFLTDALGAEWASRRCSSWTSVASLNTSTAPIVRPSSARTGDAVPLTPRPSPSRETRITSSSISVISPEARHFPMTSPAISPVASNLVTNTHQSGWPKASASLQPVSFSAAGLR